MNESLLDFCSISVCTHTFSTSHHQERKNYTHTTTTVLRSFVRDYPGEPVPEKTLTHPPS